MEAPLNERGVCGVPAEGVATNVLSDRLARLEQTGLVLKARDPADGRRFVYRLTEDGKRLLPLLVDIIVWSASVDDETAAPASFIRAAKRDRAGLLRRLRAALDDD
ncbi:MAG: winged helix-turn-helix transcriptional regulator [Myxococcota bacterium]